MIHGYIHCEKPKSPIHGRNIRSRSDLNRGIYQQSQASHGHIASSNNTRKHKEESNVHTRVLVVVKTMESLPC